jgi:hypothetical protein
MQASQYPDVVGSMSIKMLETWLNAMVTDRYDQACKVVRQAGKIGRKVASGGGGRGAAAPAGTAVAAALVPLGSIAEKTAQFLAAFYHQVHSTTLPLLSLDLHVLGTLCSRPPIPPGCCFTRHVVTLFWCLHSAGC